MTTEAKAKLNRVRAQLSRQRTLWAIYKVGRAAGLNDEELPRELRSAMEYKNATVKDFMGGEEALVSLLHGIMFDYKDGVPHYVWGRKLENMAKGWGEDGHARVMEKVNEIARTRGLGYVEDPVTDWAAVEQQSMTEVELQEAAGREREREEAAERARQAVLAAEAAAELSDDDIEALSVVGSW